MTKIVAVSAGWHHSMALEQIDSQLDSGSDLIGRVYARGLGGYGIDYTVMSKPGRVRHSVSLDESGVEQVTTYEYDDVGKEIAVIDRLGHKIDNPNNNLYGSGIALSDGTVNATTIDFGSFDYDVYVGGADTGNFTDTHVTDTFYEGSGRTEVMNPAGNSTKFLYDALGQVIRTEYPPVDLDGDDVADEVTYSHIGYDGVGRKAWEIAQTEEPDADSVTKEERRDV